MRFLPFLLLLSPTLLAQIDLSGRWEGVLDQTQDAQTMPGYQQYWENGVWEKGQPTHNVVYTLQQTAGGQISGTYQIITRTDPEHYGIFTLSGRFAANCLTYRTDRRTKQTKPLIGGFCFNEAGLVHVVRGDYEYLEGNWSGWSELGLRCASATVSVRRPLTEQTRRQQQILAAKPPMKPPVSPAGPASEAAPLSDRRQLEVTDTYRSASDSVLIRYWDDDHDDGDTISLRWNGVWVVEKQPVSRAKKELVITLSQPTNTLEMFAENLGRIPPNTASVSVTEPNGREQVFTLRSNFEQSAAIRIVRKEDGGRR